ncbi:MAG: DUF2892 domain-containing protein [Mycobacteriales bacterium]|nr:DUF2892 domain-containing protein [Mycobacteriales bacterium]
MTTCTPPVGAWPTTRILFALAGTVTLLTSLLAVLVSPWWLAMTAFVGSNQLLYVAVGACPVSMVVDRLRARTTVDRIPEEDTCSSTTTR